MTKEFSMEAENFPPICEPADMRLGRPRQILPAGATDCHCHVFQDLQRYPYNSNRSYTPPAATLEQYMALCNALGIERTVQVSASVYGFDNSLTIDVIAALGQHRARGVAGLAPDIKRSELDRLHAGGMRGARLSTGLKGYGGIDVIDKFAELLRPLGWHLQLHVHRVDELVELESMLVRTPVSVVFDHLGSVRGGEGIHSPGFQALLRMLRQRDDFWTKLSSWYRYSDALTDGYDDMRPMVEALVQARPDRLIFGTNWPHPRLFNPKKIPKDYALVDQLCEWVSDADLQKKIFVHNATALYGFDMLECGHAA